MYGLIRLIIIGCVPQFSENKLCFRDAADGLPATLNGVIDGALQQQSMMTDAPEAVQPLPSAAEAGTGWAEQGMHIDGQGGLAQHDDMVAAKFKPGIKFKLGM